MDKNKEQLTNSFDDLPLISVVMPVYNAEKYLAEAIESILTQTYTKFEFLIFNDGSKDKSVQIVNEYAQKDKRIVFFDCKENGGLIQRLNDGIDNAKGKYIARMDNDDISLPTRFEEQVQFMEANEDIGICGTYFDVFEKNSNAIMLHIQHPITDNQIKLSLLTQCVIGHPTVMARTELLKNNLYSLEYNAAEDYELWARLVLKTKFYNLPKVLLLYRWHGQNMSLKQSEAQLSKAKEIQINQLQRLGLENKNQAEQIWQFLFLNDYYLTIDKKGEIVNIIKNIQNIYIFNSNHKIYDTEMFSKLFHYKVIKLIKRTLLRPKIAISAKHYLSFISTALSQLTWKGKVFFIVKLVIT